MSRIASINNSIEPAGTLVQDVSVSEKYFLVIYCITQRNLSTSSVFYNAFYKALKTCNSKGKINTQYSSCELQRVLSFATLIGNALVVSKLDYCNFLLASITEQELRRMRLVQNILCRVVWKLLWRPCVSKCLRSLHWLPIKIE